MNNDDLEYFRHRLDSLSATYSTASAEMATLRGQIMWDGKPVIDDDDGGTAGVREPRRPFGPGPLSGGAALAFEPEYAFA